MNAASLLMEHAVQQVLQVRRYAGRQEHNRQQDEKGSERGRPPRQFSKVLGRRAPGPGSMGGRPPCECQVVARCARTMATVAGPGAANDCSVCPRPSSCMGSWRATPLHPCSRTLTRCTPAARRSSGPEPDRALRRPPCTRSSQLCNSSSILQQRQMRWRATLQLASRLAEKQQATSSVTQPGHADALPRPNFGNW